MNQLHKLSFKKSEIFRSNSTLTFIQPEKPNEDKIKFFFLVGNNGSGKTSVLNYIFNGLGEGKNGFYGNTNLKQGTKFDVFLTGKEHPIEFEVDTAGIKNNGFPDGIKIIYDEINTAFQTDKIISSTAVTVDEDKLPKERSTLELGKIIPQLLVNLKAEDDSYVSDYVNEHNAIPVNYKRRIDRFTDAFERMYNGSKKFKSINNEEGEKKIIFTDIEGKDVSLNSFSTGEKQIVFRVGNLLKNLGNIDNGIILIDEPETSLHPIWQRKYIDFLKDVFEGLNIQFIIATHSPYILQGIKDEESVVIKLNRSDDFELGSRIGYYPHSLKNPSVNLINYLAYDIVDELLHIELFAALEIKNGVGYGGLKDILNTDTTVEKKTYIASKKYNKINIGDSISEALPVFIRNAIHHPEEINRTYNQKELKDSINIMLEKLK